MTPRFGAIAPAVLSATIALAGQGTQGTAVPQTSGPGSAVPGANPAPAPVIADGLVTGRVVAADGAPVAAALVTISGGFSGARGSGPAFPMRMITDAEGRFFFGDLPPGSFTIAAAKPGFLSGAAGRTRPDGSFSPMDLEQSARRSELKIMMWRPGVIAGRVLDDSGDPLVDAEVRALPVTIVAGRRGFDTPVRTKTNPPRSALPGCPRSPR